jgi:hypothetical protein
MGFNILILHFRFNIKHNLYGHFLGAQQSFLGYLICDIPGM